MSVRRSILDRLDRWVTSAPPASEGEIKSLCRDAGYQLPESLLQFYRCTNGGEGELDIEPGWFWILPASGLVEHNQAYEVREFLPGFFSFGSSGGGQLLALDFRQPGRCPVCSIPCDCLDAAEAVELAPDFATFVMHLGQPLQD